MSLLRSLDSHRGCVNTLQVNSMKIYLNKREKSMHLSSNFFNQFHLKNCRRFSTSSRLSFNNEETTKSEKKSDKNDNEYIHMHHKTKGFVGYHTPKPKKWKKHKEKDYDIMMTLAIAVLGGFALYSIGARSARAE